MQEVKTKKQRGSLLLKIAVFCFAAFIVTLLISQQMSIHAKSAELSELNQRVEEQKVINEELRYDLEAEDSDNTEYAEKIARRELDYVQPGERVYYNVDGSK